MSTVSGSWATSADSAIVDDALSLSLSPDFPLGSELEVLVRRESTERFVAGAQRGRASPRLP